MSIRRALISLIGGAPFSIRQGLLGSAYLLIPRRLPGLFPLAISTLRDLPKIRRPVLPTPQDALNHPDGLCGLAGRIGVPELIEGYGSGMFVMSHIGPLKWWTPQHRMVLFFDQARIEKTARRLLRNRRFKITFDSEFREVMRGCAKPRDGGTPLTWITPRIQELFQAAHAEGHAHSVEVWENDILVGGIYGLAVGHGFFTESQFHTIRDASKIGFAVLNRHLQFWGFAFNDGKHPTRYLADCGMKPITRAEFSCITQTYCGVRGRPGKWTVEPDLLDDLWNPVQSPSIRMAEVLPGGTQCPWTIEQLLSAKRSPTW